VGRRRTREDEVLLENAMLLFWRHGYASTGVRDLEQALHLKAPSLYSRFGSKDGLFRAALEHYLDAVISWRITHYLQADDPLVGLRKFFDTTYNYIGASKPAIACLLVNTALETPPQNTAVHALLAKGAARLVAGIHANLERAQQQGLISADADLQVLAEHLLICLHGLTVASKIETDKLKLSRQVDQILSVLPLLRPQSERGDNAPAPDVIGE
jgi:TetR/AcrR family transcriptional repressor of nem operon